ncbi:choice-of-anchor D domain-containing protein [Nitrososphaera sp.]|uniref:beta strand repeat-containing protein n=1 Tax=Nitrososphaera sp. TaxID=1971748 RepID=UPI002ED8CAFB
MIWDGGGDGVNWSDADNWDGNIAPADGDVIVIDGDVGVDSVVHLDTNFTLTYGSITINSGDELVIDPTYELILSNSGGTGITNSGTISNSGTITVVNSGIATIGITNSGTISNSGELSVENTGEISTGIVNEGTLTNFDTLTVANSEISNYAILNIGTITNENSGTLSVENSSLSSTGILNEGTITNFGTITVLNSNGALGFNSVGSEGINNHGTITNSGELSVENTGEGSTGITNSGTLTNSGTITVVNSDFSNVGILNIGTITNENSGTLSVENSGPFTIGIGNAGTLTNSGTITVLNSSDALGASSIGITNIGTITNSGTLTVSNSSDNALGIRNHDIGTITNSGTITVSNSDFNSLGITNIGTLANSGDITVSNSGVSSFGIFNIGTITNSGTITVSNSGSNSRGILNDGTLANSGDITVSNSGVSSFGVFNSSNGSMNIMGGGAYNNNLGSATTNEGTINIYFGGTYNNNEGSTTTNLGNIFRCSGGVFNNFGTFNGNPLSELPCVIINEVELNPPGNDNISDDGVMEQVELYNPSSEPVDVSGWTVSSTHGTEHETIVMPSDTIIPVGGFLLVGLDSQWLDNDDETVILKNTLDVQVNSVGSFATPPLDEENDSRSWQLCVDGSYAWLFRESTLGQANDCLSEPPPAQLDVTPSDQDFGSAQINTDGDSHQFTVTNTGQTTSGTISLANGGTNPGDYLLQLGDTCTGATLASGLTCNFTLMFHPLGVGSRPATVTASEASGSSDSANLTGEGTEVPPTPAQLDVTPSDQDFGSAQINTDGDSHQFTVTNTGQSTSPAIAVSLGGSDPGDFSVTNDNCSSQTLAVGASCTFDVTFTPTATGPRSATVTASATGVGSASASLAGNGTAPPTSPADALRVLIIKAEGMGIDANMLNQAPGLLEDDKPNNDASVCGKLGAFINHVEVQAGKKLTHQETEELIVDAQEIEDTLGC